MHYSCEIILPPQTKDVEAAIKSVMNPFDENGEDPRNSFWDFYVIGGRFAGNKLIAKCDKTKIDAFYDWIKSEGVTVSSLQCGKQKLDPESQIEKVDARWNELFPSDSGVLVACPLFEHSSDQYGRDGNGTIEGDICTLGEAMSAECGRVIFAGPSFDSDTSERTGPLEAIFMLCGSQWNGVNHMDIQWAGTVRDAVVQFRKKLANYAPGYREQMNPEDDWIAVTVDYHS